MRIRRGMTLLEVVVALTVAGAALAAGASVLGFLTDQQERTGTREIASAYAARAAIREWASAALLTTEGDAKFQGASDLTFVTSAATDVAPAGTQVRLHLQEGAGLVAELTPWRSLAKTDTITIARNATGFSARYLVSVFGDRVWQPSWTSTSVLPAAIELRIQFDTSASTTDKAARSLLALPMLIPLGARR